jgi:hypothetical protein
MSDDANKTRSGKGRPGARGGGRGNHPGRPRFGAPKEPLNSDEAVPLLRCGPANNFIVFKKRLAVACMERYGDLGRLIEDDAYYVPPEIDRSGYSTMDELEKDLLKDKLKRREAEIAAMERNHTVMYAYIMSKLSKESKDELECEETYATHSKSKDPLMLWVDVKIVHMKSSVSQVDAVVKKTAKDDYIRCHQAKFEPLLEW